MRSIQLIAAGLLTFALSGCYKYACPAPEGTTCKSISEIYQMSNEGKLDKKKTEKMDDKKSAAKKKEKALPVALKSVPIDSSEDEIKLAPQQIVPIKLFKYVDSDGDLHYPGYLFMVIQKSPWGSLGQETSPVPIHPPSQANLSDPEKPALAENGASFSPGQNNPAGMTSLSGLNFQSGPMSPQQSGLMIPAGATGLTSGGKP